MVDWPTVFRFAKDSRSLGCGRGHLEHDALAAPQEKLSRLSAIHAELGGDEHLLASKRVSHPKIDMVLAETVLVEVDEFQHFTTARMRMLAHYDGVQVQFDVGEYLALCRAHASRADAYRQAKIAADFPFPGGRTAQRAYLDSVRDMIGPAFGHQVIRIPAPFNDVGTALEDLRRAATRLGARS